MTPERLQELISRFPTRRLAIVGDYFLDKYLDIAPELAERSIETGKTAHQVVGVRCCAGAAGTIVNNLASLGCTTLSAIGLTGRDGEGFELRECLRHLDCSTDGLIECPRFRTPTYLKPRDISDPSLAGEHNRYDTKNRTPTPDDVVEQVIQAVDAVLPDLDGLIISDQVEEAECGVVTSAVRDILADRATRWPNVVFWADSRRRIWDFRNVVTKPNQFEAARVENPLPDDRVDADQLTEAITVLRKETGASVFVTLGEKGMLVSDPEPTLVPGIRVEGPIDTTGAGDSATAGAVLALTSGATEAEAALVGNLVASITVQQLATTGTATPDQLLQRLDVWHQL